MKYPDEYRDGPIVRTLVSRILSTATRQWVLMEVCGGPTRAVVKRSVSDRVKPAVEMIHGPGCPVCVAPVEQIDKALRVAAMPNVIFTSVGDLLRVPGGECDRHPARAWGGNARTVYSPLDALDLAVKHPDKEVVVFAVGFETTAPANAMAVWRAHQLGERNFSVLVAHVTVPSAMVAVLENPAHRVQAFLVAGHACGVMGWMDYEPIAVKYRVPIVVTGFEPVDILEGMYLAVQQLEEGRYEVENQYVRSVRREGTPPARDLVSKVFQLVDRRWRGLGVVPVSGLALRAEYAGYDAEVRFGLADLHVEKATECHP